MLTTRVALRRALLAQQGLLGERASGGAGGAVAWVRRHGFLPLEVRAHALVPGHDIALFNRISGYQAGDLEMLIYDNVQLFEHSLHVPGALPVRDYALIYDPARAAAASRPGSVGALVLEALVGEGPATLRDLQAHLRSLGQQNRREVGRAVRELYASGAILIRRREGSQELLDQARRVLRNPGEETLTLEERLRALAHRTLHILAPVTRATWSQVLNAIGSRAGLGLEAMKREKRRLMAELLAEKVAVQVEVQDPPAWYLVPAAWLPALAENPETGAPRLCFLSPLDPVVWDRQRVRDLFGFDWREPIYPSSPERRFSAGALWILYGQALVGRLEPQMSWSNQRLLVHGIQLEEQSLLEDQRFRAAFTAAIRELADLHEARHIEAAGPLPPRLLL